MADKKNQKRNQNQKNKSAPDQKNKPAMVWILKVSGRYKWNIAGLIFSQTVLALLGVFSAWLFQNMINAAADKIPSQFTESASMLVLIYAVMLTLQALIRFLREFTLSGLENQLKNRLFSTLLKKEYSAVTSVHSGEWMNRLSSDVRITSEGITNILPDVAGMLVRMIGALLLLTVLLPEIMTILFPGACLMILLTFTFRRRLKRLHKAQQEAEGIVRIHLLEHLSNLIIIHSFSREHHAVSIADEKMKTHRAARMKRNHFSNLCNIGFGAAVNGAYIAGAVYCCKRIFEGSMNYGTLTAVLQLIGQIQAPFANITGYFPQYYAMLASAERLMEAEYWPSDTDEPFKSSTETQRFYQDKFKALTLKDAVFSYRNSPHKNNSVPHKNSAPPVVLDHVNISIKKGETVAFTGPSGCGKSTVLKLFLSLYPLDSGQCILDSKTGKLPLTAAWRKLFAYVPQGNQLMSGTIREAVTFDDPEGMKREGEIWNALAIADASAFVSGQPDGLETMIGEHGRGLSEGQLQRLAIARAVFSARPILLLDEATSALDEAAETRLLNNLRRMTDRTILIVTHRPAVLAICDREIRFSSDGIHVLQSEDQH